jgi:anti-anti-sigma factor
MAVVRLIVRRPDTWFDLTVVDLGPMRAAICAFGELDLAARPALAEGLQQQQDAGRRFVRLDLSGVTFLDCSCLGVLVAFHHRFLELHGLLILTGVNAHVARLLTLIGLHDTLFVIPDDQEPFGCLPLPLVTPDRIAVPAASVPSLAAVAASRVRPRSAASSRKAAS